MASLLLFSPDFFFFGQPRWNTHNWWLLIEGAESTMPNHWTLRYFSQTYVMLPQTLLIIYIWIQSALDVQFKNKAIPGQITTVPAHMKGFIWSSRAPQRHKYLSESYPVKTIFQRLGFPAFPSWSHFGNVEKVSIPLPPVSWSRTGRDKGKYSIYFSSPRKRKFWKATMATSHR